MNVNKKIVMTTLICYSIHRFGFGSPNFSFWSNAEGGPKDKSALADGFFFLVP